MEKENLIYLNVDDNPQKKKKKFNISRLVGVIILVILVLTCVITYILYVNNEEIRAYIDENILSKEIEENNLNKILLSDYDKSTVFAYQDKIMILNGNKMAQYNTSAKKENELNIEIGTPTTSINGEYFAIAEKGGSKIYMIKDQKISWKKDIEGQITKINVNKSGYTAVVVSGTAYKSVIILFDDTGTEIFKTYLSSTLAVDVTISSDNKYLAYAELNTSGTLIQSNVKIISIETAKKKPTEGIVYTYKADSNKLILKMQYQTNDKLVCMYDDEICIINNNQNETVTTFSKSDNKVTFASIDLSGYSAIIEESSSNLFNTQSLIRLINNNSLKESKYKFSGVAKEIYTARNKIAINLGSEIHFINTNGWLIKKYTAGQEARNIVISEKIAGIVYRDKIEIVKL